MPNGWLRPLNVANVQGPRHNTILRIDDNIFARWAAHNAGANDIEGTFFIDLVFDDMVVTRWRINGLSSRFFNSVTDWDKLPGRIRLEQGVHTLKLVVDPTNLISETDETDNVFEREFTWGPPSVPPASAPTPTRLPDFVPSTPNGWSAPLIATSYSGGKVDGPLATNVPTYIRYGVKNIGLSSAPGDFGVHVLLDDVVVRRRFISGLLANKRSVSNEWDELFEVINVEPGTHTLTLVIDATDLITEADEENNTFEKQFTWGTTPVPPPPVASPVPTPTPPPYLTLPNLVPGWSFGWDGPIIVSHTEETFLDSPLTVDLDAFVDIVIDNRSNIDAGAYDVDLFFDDDRIHTFSDPAGLPSGFITWFEDWDGLADLAQLTPGAHTLKIVIDPDNSVEEANEDDNVYEKIFAWAAGDVQDPAPTSYTHDDLRQILADLQSVIDTREPALSPNGVDHTDVVLDVMDAGYYIMTGKSIGDERVEIFLLTHADYLAWIDEDYATDSFAVSEEAEYPSILAEREDLKTGAAGFQSRRFGKVAIVIDVESTVADVLNMLAHEIGHMRQEFLNPTQSDADSSDYLDAIQEAEAQQFERAVWLALEEFTGQTILAYPDYLDFHDLTDDRFDFWLDNRDVDGHDLGSLLQSLAVLDDPNLETLKVELQTSGRLNAESALALYDYLVGLEPDAIQDYIAARLQSLDAHFETMKALARDRLISGLHPDLEGSSDLRTPGLPMR